MTINIRDFNIALYLRYMKIKIILFIFTLSLCDFAAGQDNSFTETYLHFRKYDKEGIQIHDWITQTNSFVYNANGTTDLIWINEFGFGDTLIVCSEVFIDYNDDGEEYEYRRVFSISGLEEFYVIRFSDFEILRFSFDDGELWEFGN